MASSLISSSHHIDFDSVFSMEDASLAPVFESLITTGLKEFLGCPVVFYEAALTEFFANGSVRDGLVVSTIGGTAVEISESVFAATFELPSEGLTDLSDVPKNLVFDARSLFSDSKEQVSISCFKKEMKIEYRRLHDILAKTIYVKVGSFDAVTHDRFMLMTAITFDVKINWSNLLFGVLKAMVKPGSRQAKGFAIQEIQDSKDETDFDVDIQELPVFDETRTVLEAGEKAISSKQSAEEHMSIDDLLMQISEDMMLPSVTAAEITKIRLGESISINEVRERDVYLANLPRISIHDKGKDILEENEPVRGNPARETVDLIYGDVEFLVRLRDQVMVDVVEFFHSFSLNKLSNLDSLRDLKAKEKLMLEWAETDSLEMAVKRKTYILAKYRELLLRKFLDSHRKYFAPGQPWTAMAAQIVDMLSSAHSKSLDVLQAEQQLHRIEMTQPGCSISVFDSSAGSGAVLAQFYSVAKSTFWVRPMILVDGVWTPLQGNDFCKSSCRLSLFVNRRQVPTSVVEKDFVPHDYLIEPVQYWGAAPSLIKTWGWARVCTKIIRYSMFGCLRPVCREIVVYNLGVERIPDYLVSAFQKGVCTDTFVGYFSGSCVQTDSEIELSSSDGDTVYRSPSPILQETDSFEENLQFALGPVVSTVAQEEQLYIVESPEYSSPMPQRQESSSSSSDSQMHFDSNDFPLDDTTEAQTSLPAATVDLSSFLGDLKTFLSQRMDDVHSDILSRLHSTERSLQTSLGHQNEYLRSLIQGARQEGQIQDDLKMMRLNELKKLLWPKVSLLIQIRWRSGIGSMRSMQKLFYWTCRLLL
ncbi:hypothetical protein F511_28060 [Dorcoceras hygrometricum]|uniref:Dystroglycan-like n=1 Tax=Dorcoceras hygrometricum TaxID=472368 RepID=A0A2Z7AIK9_9LAMI|nr:hypothetical protein F511_28060 [Dorcoceras hygrometricum]